MDLIFYQLRWTTRRQQHLSPISEKTLRRSMHATAKEKGWDISFLYISGADVLLHVRVDKKTSAHAVQYWLKRGSVTTLRKRRDFRNLPSVWTRNYQAKTLEGVLIE